MIDEPAITEHDLHYRPVADVDGPALFRLFLQVHAAEIGALAADAGTRQALASMQYVEQRVRARAEFPDAVDLAIERDGTVCGRVATVMRAGGIQLIQLAVLAEERGHGIGTAAMQRIARIAEDHGCAIWLRADAGSCDCRAFLERIGFTVTGRAGRLIVSRTAAIATAA